MMNLPKFNYIQPHSLNEACLLLKEYENKATLLAGGTNIVVILRYRLKKPEVVIGLKGLEELKYISRNENGISIGSMVTLETIEKSPVLIKDYPSLISAIQMVAIPPIRKMATIGGNICLDNRCIYYNQSEFWRSTQEPCLKLGGKVCYAVEGGKRCQSVYSGDLAPILISLGAEAKIISSQEERIVPLAEFFTKRGEKPNVLKSNELLLEIRLPYAGKGTGSAYEKLRVREGMDFPMASVAVMLKEKDDETIEDAKVVLGAVGTSPIEVPIISSILKGKKPSEDLIDEISKKAIEAASPVENLIIDRDYRKKMIGVLIKRAFKNSLKMAKDSLY